MTPHEILKLITSGGAAASPTITLMMFFIAAIWKKWIVLGVTHDAMEKDLRDQLSAMTNERNEWRSLSLSSTTLAESLIEVAKLHQGVAPFGSNPQLLNGKNKHA